MEFYPQFVERKNKVKLLFSEEIKPINVKIKVIHFYTPVIIIVVTKINEYFLSEV